MMDASKEGKLHSLLFDEERELVNIKFFPGTDRGLTANQLSDAAADAIRSVLSRKVSHNPPSTGQQKVQLEDFNPSG